MATFRYSGLDANGQSVSGRIDASDPNDAREKLAQRRIANAEVVPCGDSESLPAPVAMNVADAEEFAHTVAQLSRTDASLALGLQAAADEASNARVASALHWLAAEIERGQSLEAAVRSADKLLPRPMQGLILAAAGTGRLGESLTELIAQFRTTRSLRRGIAGVFAYPAFIAASSLAVLTFVFAYLTPAFERIFLDFGLRLPLLTEVLLWFRHTGVWIVLGLITASVVLAMVYRLVGGRERWQRQIATFPLLGPLWYWLAIAEWSGLVAVLVRYQVTLPDALRLAADGVRNAYVGHLSLQLAEGVSAGKTLSQSMSAQRGMPRSIVPLIRWGEQTGTLADALSAGSDMFQNRVRRRSLLLQLSLPPALFIVIACSVLFIVTSLFLPLFTLIQALS
jgi:type II secretory pathway component PulF